MAEKESKKLEQLSIFLIKPDFVKRDEIIKVDDCKDPIEIPIPGCGTGSLYIKKQSRGRPPKWSSFFQNAIDISILGKVSTVSAALVVKVSGSSFVLSFGQSGRFLLENDVCEERFGLLVALNSVDKESFRCVDKQSLDSIESQTRVQSGYATTSDQFGLDVEQDMLKAIVGSPTESVLGNRMTGIDSLTVTVRADLANLKALLIKYKEKYETDLSSSDYELVNNMAIVKNKSVLVEQLNNEIVNKLNDKDFTSLWLSIPQIIDWRAVKGFISVSYTHLTLPTKA